ncbi:hypothetical protein TNCV_2978881 [Trichonephila clavipes]|nr:hypothetical protein TNCV_2978881 [Trichonephila clavipes]
MFKVSTLHIEADLRAPWGMDECPRRSNAVFTKVQAASRRATNGLTKKKSNSERSGDRVGHETELLRPILCPGYATSRQSCIEARKCTGAPSCVIIHSSSFAVFFS